MVSALRYTQFPLRDLGAGSLQGARREYHFMARGFTLCRHVYADGRGGNPEQED
jgi:hypothetical protein